MKATDDGGKSWHEFLPNEPNPGFVDFSARFIHPLQFITKSDWEGLRRSFAEIPEPSVALETLCYGHELLDQGLVRHALVEIMTAIELAVNDFTRRIANADKSIQTALQSFYDRPLKERIAVICLARDIDRTEVEHAVRAIEARNALVHTKVRHRLRSAINPSFRRSGAE
jgi:hypothetical protein